MTSLRPGGHSFPRSVIEFPGVGRGDESPPGNKMDNNNDLFESSLQRLRKDFEEQGAPQETIDEAIRSIRLYEKLKNEIGSIYIREAPIEKLKALFEVPEIFRSNPFLYIDMRKTAHYNAFLLGYQYARQEVMAWELHDLIRSDRGPRLDSNS